MNDAELTKLDFYKAYLHALEEVIDTGRMMPFDWIKLPHRLSLRWMAYSQMADEGARELANIVNRFTLYVRQLEAWGMVVATLSDMQKMEINLEFTETLTIVATTLPYIIRSRFYFIAAHVCHQANQAKQGPSWVDDLRPDDKIVKSDAVKAGSPWSAFASFQDAVQSIDGVAFRDATGDFRHAYNHRLPARFLVGMSQSVARRKDKESGRIRYEFGGREPLSISELVPLLTIERDLSYRAFEAFQTLVRQQEAEISTANDVDLIDTGVR